MKRSIILVMISLLFAYGCYDNNSIVEPESVNSFSKLYQDQTPDLEKYKFVHSSNFTVNGDSGAVLFVKHSWRNDEGEKIKLNAKLKIPQNAFIGTLDFEIYIDLEDYTIDLYPSPYSFEKPLELDLSFTGVSFAIGDSDFTFTYLDGNEVVEFELSKYDPDKKVLQVKKAQINHFSRYGWLRNAR